MVIVGHISFNLISVVLSEILQERLAVLVLLVGPAVMVGCGVLLIKQPGATSRNSLNDEAPEYETPAPWNI